jgi:signal peptidase
MKLVKIILNFGYKLFLVIIVCLALLLFGSSLPIVNNYRVLTVLSGSMEPAIHTGSVVVVAPTTDYKIGEVITFGEIGKDKIPVTHRIKDIKIIDSKSVYITKGDANNAEDGSEIPQSEIKGRVLFAIPFLGYALNFVKQPIGFALVIIVPAILIIWEEMKKIIGEIKKNKKKAEPAEVEKKDENQNV